MIALAADIGCRRLRVFGGDFPQNVTRQQAIESLVRSLARSRGPAEQKGVIVCLETHDSWCDPAVVADVMRQVNSASVGVNWDVMHPVRTAGWTMERAYETLRPWMRHVHVHDGLRTLEKLVMVPIGQGELDHAAAMRLLVRDKYDGFVSGEWIAATMTPEFFAVHLMQELAALKRLENGQ